MQFYITYNYELNIKTKISYCLIPTQKVFTLGIYFSIYKTL